MLPIPMQIWSSVQSLFSASHPSPELVSLLSLSLSLSDNTKQKFINSHWTTTNSKKKIIFESVECAKRNLREILHQKGNILCITLWTNKLHTKYDKKIQQNLQWVHVVFLLLKIVKRIRLWKPRLHRSRYLKSVFFSQKSHCGYQCRKLLFFWSFHFFVAVCKKKKRKTVCCGTHETRGFSAASHSLKVKPTFIKERTLFGFHVPQESNLQKYTQKGWIPSASNKTNKIICLKKQQQQQQQQNRSFVV